MNDYKSVQELIVKAALYDGVSTTISPYVVDSDHVITIKFSKNGRHSATYLDLTDRYRRPEEAALYVCKRALMDLLFAPYDEIEVHKEDGAC